MADIVAWLKAHGLEKFAPAFAQHEIDFDTLGLLTEDDVRELGLPLGPRRRLLAALGVLRSEAAPSPRDEAERRQLTVMLSTWPIRRRLRRGLTLRRCGRFCAVTRTPSPVKLRELEGMSPN